jgi:ferric-dicitrate binding protein FerR (iron transport regulator)
MKLEVTREVVNDLWPLCRSGEASGDSRALVDRFLAEDREFASMLAEAQELRGAMPNLRLSAEAERQLLDSARSRARTRLLLTGGAIAMGGLILLVALVGLLFLKIVGGG